MSAARAVVDLIVDLPLPQRPVATERDRARTQPTKGHRHGPQRLPTVLPGRSHFLARHISLDAAGPYLLASAA